jgi:DNA-binding NarL/FixJ family response regulator
VPEPVPLPYHDDAIQVPRILLLGRPSQEDVVASLTKSEHVSLVGKVSSTDEALRLLDELEPDLVLIDLDEEDTRADQPVGRIIAARPGVPVVGVTRDTDAPWVGEAVREDLTAVVSLSEDRGGEQLVADVCVLAATLGARHENPSSAGR